MLRKVAKVLLGLVCLLIIVVGGLLAWSHFSVQGRVNAAFDVSTAEADFTKADIELGHRVVKIRNGCVDCHGEDLGGMKIMEDPVFARSTVPI